METRDRLGSMSNFEAFQLFDLSHQAYSGTLTRREIVRANASLGELRRDKEKLSCISCEFVRVKTSQHWAPRACLEFNFHPLNDFLSS